MAILKTRDLTDEFGDYVIDTSMITCTCPDFIKSRSFLNRDDPGRLCKHLVYVYTRFDFIPKPLKLYLPKLQILKESKHGFPLDKSPFNLILDELVAEVWIPHEKSNDYPIGLWCDVYTERNLYSYNYKEYRWSGRNEPASAKKIMQFIHDKMGIPLISESVPVGSIVTIGRQGMRHIGKAGDVEISAEIMPRNHWMSLKIGTKDAGMVNVKEARSIIRPELIYMEPAIIAWVTDEYNKLKIELNETESKSKKEKRKEELVTSRFTIKNRGKFRPIVYTRFEYTTSWRDVPDWNQPWMGIADYIDITSLIQHLNMAKKDGLKMPSHIEVLNKKDQSVTMGELLDFNETYIEIDFDWYKRWKKENKLIPYSGPLPPITGK